MGFLYTFTLYCIVYLYGDTLTNACVFQMVQAECGIQCFKTFKHRILPVQ